VLKTEHVALLAALNDDEQYRRGKVSTKLRELPSDRVSTLLEGYFSHVNDSNMLLRIDPILEPIMRRGPKGESLAEYLRIVRTYLERDVRILTFWDTDYPPVLRNIPQPPLILFVRGKIFPGSDRIAIVGTREASEHGLELSRVFARELAEEGHTIVSGLASGIDTAVHEGALEGGGSTIAVLAGDVDNIYPDENVELARRMIEQGSIVSEITPQVEMRRGRFVERNRITSGLSEAVVIIETGKSGGTIRQAEYARSQKRPIYVVDHGRFERPESEEGFQHLVNSGAIPIRQPAELSELISH